MTNSTAALVTRTCIKMKPRDSNPKPAHHHTSLQSCPASGLCTRPNPLCLPALSLQCSTSTAPQICRFLILSIQPPFHRVSQHLWKDTILAIFWPCLNCKQCVYFVLLHAPQFQEGPASEQQATSWKPCRSYKFLHTANDHYKSLNRWLKSKYSQWNRKEWKKMQSDSQRRFQEDSGRWTKQPNIQPIRLAHLSPPAQSRALALPSYSGVIFVSLLSFSCWWSKNRMRWLVPHSQLWKWLRVLHPKGARPNRPQLSLSFFLILTLLQNTGVQTSAFSAVLKAGIFRIDLTCSSCNATMY